MVELPLARKRRFMTDYGLPASDAEMFVNDMALGNYYEGAISGVKSPKAVANWVINGLQAKLAEGECGLTDLKFNPGAIGELVGLVEGGQINSRIAQEVFAVMFDTGKAPAVIVEEKGLAQVNDTSELGAMCREVIEANPGPAEDFRNGKEAALNFLKGQVMKTSRGMANPQVVGELLEQILNNE